MLSLIHISLCYCCLHWIIFITLVLIHFIFKYSNLYDALFFYKTFCDSTINKLINMLRVGHSSFSTLRCFLAWVQRYFNTLHSNTLGLFSSHDDVDHTSLPTTSGVNMGGGIRGSIPLQSC